MQTKLIKECGFCKGEFKSADGVVDGGQMTMRTMLGIMIGKNPSEDDGMGIKLYGDKLFFDNSSGEYTDGFVQINYCPFCGKELKNDSND